MIRLITFSDFDAHTSPLFFQLKLLKLQDHIKLQTLYTNSLSENYQRVLTHFLFKLQISIMSTLALQLGQLFMFQKFEQTMVKLIFDTMDLSYGTKLMRDLRF